jgi:hypothetical protein
MSWQAFIAAGCRRLTGIATTFDVAPKRRAALISMQRSNKQFQKHYAQRETRYKE